MRTFLKQQYDTINILRRNFTTSLCVHNLTHISQFLGGALLWNQAVWHWGSQSNPRGKSPRYSLAMEFQALPTDSTTSSFAEDFSTSGVSKKEEFSQACSANNDQHVCMGSDVNADHDYSKVHSAENTVTMNGFEIENDSIETTKPEQLVQVYNTPLSHPLLLFTMQDRLTLIAKQIAQYRHMYPLSHAVMKLVEEILQVKVEW